MNSKRKKQALVRFSNPVWSLIEAYIFFLWKPHFFTLIKSGSFPENFVVLNCGYNISQMVRKKIHCKPSLSCLYLRLTLTFISKNFILLQFWVCMCVCMWESWLWKILSFSVNLAGDLGIIEHEVTRKGCLKKNNTGFRVDGMERSLEEIESVHLEDLKCWNQTDDSPSYASL